MKRISVLTMLTALVALWTIAVLGLVPSVTFGAVPQFVSFQGFLKGPGGQPVPDGDYTVTFKIWDAAAGGTLIWDGGPQVVTSTNGIFNALLAAPEAAFTGSGRWMGITVAPDIAELTPRIQLVSVGFSYRVGSVDGATGGEIFGDLNLHSTLTVGDIVGDTGRVEITNGTTATVIADGSAGTSGGSRFLLRDNIGQTTVDFDGDWFSAGLLKVNNAVSRTVVTTVTLDGLVGRMVLRDPVAGNGGTVLLEADQVGGQGAALSMFDAGNTETVELTADETGEIGGARLIMRDDRQTTVLIDANGLGGGAEMFLRNSAGSTTVELDGDGTAGPDVGSLRLFSATGAVRAQLNADDATTGGAEFRLRSGVGEMAVMQAAGSATTGGQIYLRSSAGPTTVILDAGGPSIAGKITTPVVEITGGSDLSEQFDVKAAKEKLEPGVVVSIDPEEPGKLVVSSQIYDRRVAGIISGAGGITTGMLMGQAGSVANGQHPVALSGRVYCWADASSGSIQPGDLLTTSDTPGYAMKVVDHRKAQGAIIGKAMSALAEGKGLVLVLVSLQ